MQKRFDVLVAGELNVDLILYNLDQFPQLEKEFFAKEMLLTLGSSSAIFASNLSVLGASVCFAGKIGKDQFADMVLGRLSNKGVDSSYIRYSETSGTGITVALNYDNERAMITYPGAMTELAEEDITDEMLQSAGHLHVGSIFFQPRLKPGLVRLFRRAKEKELTTSLDLQWDPSEKWNADWENLLPNVDLFMPNLVEAKNITGQNNVHDCINYLKNFANIIIIKNGTEGAWTWNGKTIMNQPAFLNEEVADAIGAGDSFNAGFIQRYIQDYPLKACTEFGALCGAINTTSKGGTAAFKDKESIKHIALQKFNYTINDL